MVTIEQYAGEVKKMRDLQIRYFKTRSVKVLIASKEQEKKVDDITNEILYGK